MPRPVVLVLVAILATVGLVAVALVVVGGGGRHHGPAARPSRSPVAPFSTTPLAGYRTTGVAVSRESFCSRVDPRQVAAALGGPPTAHRSWGDGDRTRLGSGLTDVSHEYGCEDAGAGGTTARAWVFAPPVRTSIAARLARSTDGTGTCASATSTFGTPSSLLTCQTARVRTATYRGLFGDAWLSCELDAPLSTPAATLADRAGRWCVGVLQAATAP